MDDQVENNSKEKIMKLSILDQSPVILGKHPEEILKNSIELAQWAEHLNYESILFSEHHGVPGYASSSPEILAAVVLAKTQKIKVGTAGIMLRNYSAYKVAGTAKLLASIFPGRFVLGLGKAPGGLKMSSLALNSDKLPTVSTITEKLQDIVGYLSDDTSSTQERYGDLIAQPQHLHQKPEVWWLGSGKNSAKEAAKNGLSYSYSHFLIDERENENTNIYKNEFLPGAITKTPHLQIALSVSVAEDYKMALRNAYSMAYQFLEARRGLAPTPLIHPDEVEERISAPEDTIEFQKVLKNIIIATPDTIGQQLSEIAAFYKTNNLIILNNVYDKDYRFKNYEWIINSVQ
ncbi:MsnO8 family LLM class oxidoreductase [Chryseobacterium paridis]|uniref:MsnO8 family LLM class oxidoreductase n=1 Tax=Chryseobacterium paridis TaxID=2800328 RepID=A0ABS1FQC9_9FLAO|nr:MsnO8 family LLM class oxidoreductase [Chryseobacterium paridis]MBK1894639.1 MsnO8 family LLM class oxidoreductase [Chryseobacterium paridis]